MSEFADVIIDISYEKLDKTFQYRIPAHLRDVLQPGMQVEVPFGTHNKRRSAYVVGMSDVPKFDVSKTKEILSMKKDSISLEHHLMSLAAWMREVYGGTMNQALKTVLPVKQKKKEKEQRTVVLKLEREEAKTLLGELERKHRTARARLLSALLEQAQLPYEVVTSKLNITAAVIRAMAEQGILEVKSTRMYRSTLSGLKRNEGVTLLHPAQQHIVEAVWSDFLAGIHKPCLIHGVTGSGKTEVYIELIARAIAQDRQAIVLIPEIALTYQTVMRFYNRFGDRVAVLHSRMAQGERYDAYEQAKKGLLDVMIGPRSALFTPFEHLGLIIIDEEHESSYKSETVPRYHARETAIHRAQMVGATVVLGSATPSMESYYRTQTGEYRLFQLKERAKTSPLPQVEVVDLREELRKGNRSILSDRLHELMEDRLNKGQQIMLFLNRRGIAGFVSCRSCGHVIKCPHCDVSLNLHKNGRMICHYCGYEQTSVQVCPECGSKYIGGFKAGTQKVEEYIKKVFPHAKVLRMDADTTRHKGAHEQILSAFANQEADILIGTQMIVKGHDFPNVTLVGVLAADMSLHISDYHGAERTFQLLTQAAGRAGRGDLPGHAVIQTYQPEHYSVQTAAEQDYEAFFEREMEFRRIMRYPPFWNMLMIHISGANEEALSEACDRIKGWIDGDVSNMNKSKAVCPADSTKQALQVFGPADAVISKVNDIFRKQIYIKSNKYENLVKLKDSLEQALQGGEFETVNVQFDFNPQ